MPAVHETDARDDAGRGRLAVVQPFGGERGEFEERAPLVEEAGDAVAREELAARHMAFARRHRTAEGDGREACAQPVGRILLRVPPARELRVADEGARERGHGISIDVGGSAIVVGPVHRLVCTN